MKHKVAFLTSLALGLILMGGSIGFNLYFEDHAQEITSTVNCYDHENNLIIGLDCEETEKTLWGLKGSTTFGWTVFTLMFGFFFLLYSAGWIE